MRKKYLLLLLLFTFLPVSAQDAFITTWDVPSNVYFYTFIQSGPGVSYTIDYGDGTVLTNQNSYFSHYYTSPGTYTITITGDYHKISIPPLQQAWIKSVEQWGSAQWSSMQNIFVNCSNLEINATDAPDLSQVTSLESIFYGCYSLNQSLNGWDVSTITNMKNTFSNTGTFNQPLDNWDVSNVTTFEGMFNGATAFNQSLNSWDVSNATTFKEMFKDAAAFNGNITNWDLSSAIDLSNMFRNADSFNQPLNNWNVSTVSNMYGMFSYTALFNQPLNDWNVSNVTTIGALFYKTSSFNQPINNWDVSNVTDLNATFQQATAFNQPLNNWDISNVVWMTDTFKDATSFNQDISTWSFDEDVYFYVGTSASSTFNGSGLDTANYDALLLRFVQLGLQNKPLGALGLQYCDADVRNYLIDNLGWTITGDSLDEECVGNIILGNVLYDENSNGCDADDTITSNLLVSAESGQYNYTTSTNTNGEYSLTVSENTYNIQLLNVPAYYTVNPATSSINFSGFGNTEALNFCLTANQSVEDLSVTVLPLNEVRPGFESNYQIVVKNMGTQTVANVSVSLTFDDALQTYVTATPAPAATTANQLTFTVTDLQPFESSVIDLTMQTFTPPTVNGGETAVFTATVTPNANDFTPADNTFELAQVVVNSYDPNDKKVLQGDEIFIEQADEYLDYIIRFQNTGSASAITVRIEDELHEKLDWTTLTPVSASHDYRVEITDGNHVEFIFDNINLPHQAADDAGSNGFIAYKIKPVEGVAIGDVFSGNASIYFDYNLPIVTNTASTEVVNSLSVNTFGVDNTVSVYPNPVNNILHLKAADTISIEQVSIINLQGRELMTQANAETLNAETLSSGVYLLVIKTNKGNITHKLVKN